MAEPTAMLVLDFQISDEQKKKLLDGLCRLITRCDIQALKVGVKSPPSDVSDGVALPARPDLPYEPEHVTREQIKEAIAALPPRDGVRACAEPDKGKAWAEWREHPQFAKAAPQTHFDAGWVRAMEAVTAGVPEGVPARGNTACNPHPDAPHGFNRNASHNAGRYVCDCEGWMPLGVALGDGGQQFWCHEESHDRPRCQQQCAECAEYDAPVSGVQGTHNTGEKP